MNVNRFSQRIKDLASGGVPADYDVEAVRKIMMINVVSVIGIANLIPLGLLALIQGNIPLGLLDFVLAAILLTNLLYLRKSQDHILSGYLGISCAGGLFVYLFVTGGQNNTGHLWYFTFPLFTSFLVGSKRGVIASLLLLVPVIWLFAVPDPSPVFAVYPTDFQLRFIPSFLVVLGYSYAFEKIREQTQHKLILKNAELQQGVVELEKARDALRTARDGLEQRVTERAAELTAANELLKREVEERRRAEERLERINSCFLNFGADPTENIKSLTNLSGELLDGTCAVYNRLQGTLLCSIGQWNTPEDYDPQDQPDGHICFDVIQKAGDDMLVIRDLPNTVYAATDPNVSKYNLKTYWGKAVKSGEEAVGSLCVVFQNDVVPTEQDRKVLEISGSAVGVEEERLRALTALQESEERYRSFVDNIDLGVTLISTDHDIAMINRAHSVMFNKPVSEFLGKKCFREFRKLEDICPDCPGVKAMSTGKAASIETPGIRDDGTDLFVRVQAFPTFGPDNEVTGFIEVVEDITDQKRLEDQLQQAQKLEAIGTLAGGIAHDFNNLLTGIQGQANLMLLKREPGDPDYEGLKSIEKQVESGARLTSLLLGYARRGKYKVQPVDLNYLIEEACETFGRAKREIVIHLDLHDELHNIEADPGQMEQVLFNLLVNAADAMPDGGDLTVKTSNTTDEAMKDRVYEPKPGRYALLTVTDTGTGMEKKTLDRVFDPFFTTKEMGRRTGLGLASAYGIIKSHGGYIDVESEPGQGTTFSICLPMSEKKVKETVRPKLHIVRGRETILLVDDEESIRKIGREILETLGYRVLLAESGKEAVDVYGRNPEGVDIVLLDMVMPNMGGGEAYDRLKKIDPDVKVLLVSGYSIEGQASEILSRGANAFIQKPFNIKELSGKIREVLGN